MKGKKCLAVLLSVAVCMAAMPYSARAAEPAGTDDYLRPVSEVGSESEIVDSGSCGENVTWTLDSEGVLTIEGEGEIESDAFYMKNDVRKVTVGEGVTCIGEYAFYGCEALTSVILPESVTSIEYRAFSDCGSLVDISLPRSLTSIGSSVFLDCSSLMDIDLPEGLVSIEERTFENCSSLKNIELPDGVTRIGDQAFFNCEALTSVSLSESLESIGDFAFYGCSSLKRMDLPRSLTSIGLRAYDSSNDDFMLYLYLNSYAESYAKEQRIPYRYLDLPDHPGWSPDEPEPDEPEYESNVTWTLDGEGVLTIEGEGKMQDGDGDKTSFYDYDVSQIKKIVVKEGITYIGYCAFSGCGGLIDVELPKSLTSIGYAAFSNCKALTRIILPENVTSIGDAAFSDCSSLADIELSKSLTSIGSSAFSGCSSLADIELPKSLTSIGNMAFYGCEALTSLDLPEGVVSIGYCAFYGCEALTSLNLPESVTSIGEQAFDYCDALILGVYSDSYSESYAFDNNIPHRFLDQPDRPAIMAHGMCGENGDNIEWTQYSDGLVKIEGSGKMSDEAWVAVHMRNMNEVKEAVIGEGITHIGWATLSGCNNLESVTLPESLTSIGDSAFDECSKLKTIKLPKGLKSIGAFAFAACGFSDISLPESLTDIGRGAFAGSGLTSIKLPKKITAMPYAFNNCLKLKTAVLSEGVTSIDDRAFNNCLKLETVVLPEGLKTIGEHAFYSCDSLKNIVLPESLEGIGKEAFWHCESLKSITLPKKVKSIGKDAFAECKNLTISVYAGTYAEKYVKKNKLPYKVLKAAKATKKTTITAKNITKTGSSGKAQSISINAKSDGTGKLSYSSDQKKVTVSSKGVVKISKGFIGTAVITIKAAASGKYKSAVKKITVTVKPPKVDLSSVKAAKKKALTVKWKKSTLCGGYEIQYADSKTFKGASAKKVGSSNTTSEQITGLKANKIYYVRIRGYKKAGGKTYYSSWSGTKSVKTKK